MNIIEVANLKKNFGKTRAIDGISFSVAKGEAFGFLGPNGAGKTTTIRCLMSFIKPSSGEIKLFEKEIIGQPELRSQIGYLPGIIKLYNTWTGNDHIKFVQSLRKINQPPLELIERLNFDPGILTKNLSTGNRQKLGLILALMASPKLLILDEPTNGLDPLLQNTIYKILEERRKEGATIFISSHNLPEVERLCSRVGIIRQGKIVALENIKDLESKRIHQVKIVFDGEYNKDDFAINDVEIVDQYDGTLSLNVKGAIDPLVGIISKYKIKDLEISHAKLEEVFLEFYRNNDQGEE